ncbi:MAG: thiamine phosphate synthase [Mariprofundaceae bacterium]
MKADYSGVYGILPSNLETTQLLKVAESALKGGLKTLQFREKKLGYKRALKRAIALRELTHQYHATFIINDSLQLAIEAKADGVHLGREDIVDLSSIRAQVGPSAIIGITCRADAVFAKLALQHGADYVSFGAVFSSSSKPNVPVLGLPRLLKSTQMFPDTHICAIGGINSENIQAVKATGVHCAAIISAIFQAQNVESETRKLIELWHQS